MWVVGPGLWMRHSNTQVHNISAAAEFVILYCAQRLILRNEWLPEDQGTYDFVHQRHHLAMLSPDKTDALPK